MSTSQQYFSDHGHHRIFIRRLYKPVGDSEFIVSVDNLSVAVPDGIVVMTARTVVYCCMHCRHVDVRTSPQSCFVFTLRTHSAVLPGTIAFNAPQVPVSILLLFEFG